MQLRIAVAQLIAILTATSKESDLIPSECFGFYTFIKKKLKKDPHVNKKKSNNSKI